MHLKIDTIMIIRLAVHPLGRIILLELTGYPFSSDSRVVGIIFFNRRVNDLIRAGPIFTAVGVTLGIAPVQQRLQKILFAVGIDGGQRVARMAGLEMLYGLIPTGIGPSDHDLVMPVDAPQGGPRIGRGPGHDKKACEHEDGI